MIWSHQLALDQPFFLTFYVTTIISFPSGKNYWASTYTLPKGRKWMCYNLLSSVTLTFYFNFSHTNPLLTISWSAFTPRFVNVPRTILERTTPIRRQQAPSLKCQNWKWEVPALQPQKVLHLRAGSLCERLCLNDTYRKK